MDLTQAAKLIEHFEGCVLHAYQDSVGVWTIGYGTTKDVRPGQVCTKEQAIEWMMRDVNECAELVQKICTPALNNNETSALVSLAYNIGLTALKNSTLVRDLNAGETKLQVADHFMDWVHAGGRVLQGLVTRRREERLIFLS